MDAFHAVDVLCDLKVDRDEAVIATRIEIGDIVAS